jgi:hypothetical protein
VDGNGIGMSHAVTVMTRRTPSGADDANAVLDTAFATKGRMTGNDRIRFGSGGAAGDCRPDHDWACVLTVMH